MVILGIMFKHGGASSESIENFYWGEAAQQ